MHPKQTKSIISFLGLGSNLGDREKNINDAKEKLDKIEGLSVLKSSSLIENPPIEDAGPDNFLNAVFKIETSLSPQELLAAIRRVEDEVDPERKNRGRKKARYLDIDILTYGDLEIKDDDLEIPHPRMHKRDFVMKPLREIQASDIAEEKIAAVDSRLGIMPVHVPLAFSQECEDKKLRSQINDEVVKLLNSNPNYKVRRMLLEDVDTIYAMDEVIFGKKHWGRDTFVRELSNHVANYLVAESKDGEIMGYGGVWLVADEMHIMTLGTAEKFRRKKVAESLVIAFINDALQNDVAAITLEVRISNTAAQDLYARYGFQHQGIRKGYYDQDQESALILWTENIQAKKFMELFLSNLTV